MRKKGDVVDILSLVIILFVIVIGFFTISFIVPYITNGLRNAGLNNSAEGTSAINQLHDFGVNGIQQGVFWLFLGLCIATWISAFYSDTHPIWLFLYVIFLIISIIIAGYLANAYQTIIGSEIFGGWSQNFMTTIMQYIVPIIIGVACLSFIIMFAKWSYFSGRQF
jgi:hypothetical protein